MSGWEAFATIGLAIAVAAVLLWAQARYETREDRCE